jgi:hypothetical protein
MLAGHRRGVPRGCRRRRKQLRWNVGARRWRIIFHRSFKTHFHRVVGAESGHEALIVVVNLTKAQRDVAATDWATM